ncbi:MAG: glycoside hydrolase family 95 protein, partial [Verrucomicrobiota bacterium]
MRTKSITSMLPLLVSIGACAFAGQDGGPVKRVVWSDTPVTIEPDRPNPARYFKQVWGSSVYPIGNGRLGATVFGGIAEEHIQFNEDTLWTGDEGDTGRYQNFGDMLIALDGHAATSPGAAKYRRELDIEKALHTIRYEMDGVHYRREYFASHPANVLVFRFTADKKGAYTGTVTLKNAHEGEPGAAGNTITISGTLGDKMDLHYEAQAMVLNTGGSVSAANGIVSFRDCDSLVILLDAGTDYLNRRDKGWKQEHPHRS